MIELGLQLRRRRPAPGARAEVLEDELPGGQVGGVNLSDGGVDSRVLAGPAFTRVDIERKDVDRALHRDARDDGVANLELVIVGPGLGCGVNGMYRCRDRGVHRRRVAAVGGRLVADLIPQSAHAGVDVGLDHGLDLRVG
jgi:hypothetical protein